MYRIRLHGRGGQGIKTASRVLGSAFFHDGFAVQDAPIYGAERRGAPITGYVRAAREAIRERGSMTNPDLVVVADESLIPVPAANVMLGIGPRTVLLIASRIPTAEWRRRLNLTGPIVTLPIDRRAVETDDLLAPHTSVACAGAAARLVGSLTRDAIRAAVRDELSGVTDDVRSANLDQALAAFDMVGSSTGIVTEGGDVSAEAYTRPAWIELAAEPAALASPDIRVSATTVETKTGTWRTHRPVVDRDRCNRCTWICSTFCPDSAIRVTSDGRPEIDYDHCKGCLVCVAVCPPHAIQAEPEPAAVEATP